MRSNFSWSDRMCSIHYSSVLSVAVEQTILLYKQATLADGQLHV